MLQCKCLVPVPKETSPFPLRETPTRKPLLYLAEVLTSIPCRCQLCPKTVHPIHEKQMLCNRTKFALQTMKFLGRFSNFKEDTVLIF